MTTRKQHEDAVDFDVWFCLINALEGDGGLAQAAAQLFDLYHNHTAAWGRLKGSLDRKQIKPLQRLLLDQLLAASQANTLEEVGARIEEIHTIHARAFWP